MSELDFSQYINQHYLLPEEVSRTAENFIRSDISLLRLPNFLVSKFALSCSRFLSCDTTYTNTYGIFSKQPPTVNEATWLASTEEERFFFYQILNGTKSEAISLNAMNFLKLRKLLRSEFFRSYIASLTELNLVSTSAMLVHRMHKGHYLKRHNDRSHNRKLAFILYMSPDWLPECGGELKIVDNQGFETSVQPCYNSLVLFDVSKHQYHYVSEVLDSSEQMPNHRNGRISINGWFS